MTVEQTPNSANLVGHNGDQEGNVIVASKSEGGLDGLIHFDHPTCPEIEWALLRARHGSDFHLDQANQPYFGNSHQGTGGVRMVPFGSLRTNICLEAIPGQFGAIFLDSRLHASEINKRFSVVPDPNYQTFWKARMIEPVRELTDRRMKMLVADGFEILKLVELGIVIPSEGLWWINTFQIILDLAEKTGVDVENHRELLDGINNYWRSLKPEWSERSKRILGHHYRENY